MTKLVNGRKRKMVTEEDSIMPEWLIDESNSPQKAAGSPTSIDPWLMVTEKSDLSTATDAAQAKERIAIASTVSVSPEMQQPSGLAQLATDPGHASVEMDSDEGQDVIISDTTFDDGPIPEDNNQEYTDTAAVDVGTTSDTHLETRAETAQDPPSGMFGELKQTVLNDSTVLLTSAAPFRAYIWGAYQVRALHGEITVHGAQLTCQQTEYVPVYALRAKAIPAIESVSSNNICDASIDSVKVSTSGVLEEQIKEVCGDNWDAVATQLDEVRSSDGWALLVRRLHSRLLTLLARKHGDTFTPAPSPAGDQLHTITGCVLLKDAAQAHQARVALYRSGADRDLLQSQLVTRPDDLRVAFAGGKGVGKSTLLYRMLNALLSRHAHLYVLDCDPGQTEFTPCACLSLVRLQRCHIGPSFTHIQQPVRSIFTGEVSVANDPVGYLSAVRALSDTYWSRARDGATAPLLVNTMGWAQGLGEALLLEVLALMQPTDVVELTDPQRPHLNFAKALDAERVNATPRGELLERLLPRAAARRAAVAYKHHRIARPRVAAPHVTKAANSPGLAPWMFRQLNTTAMVVAMEQHGRPLCQAVPSCIRWSSLAVRVQTEGQLMPQHMLHAINGCVVALCRSDPGRWLRPHDPSLFSVLPDRAPPPDCLGFGVVRGVDWDRRAIYLLTALSEAELQPVNTLIRGPHHLLDVFPAESGMPVPVWTPAITGNGGSLDRPNTGKSVPPWKKPRRW